MSSLFGQVFHIRYDDPGPAVLGQAEHLVTRWLPEGRREGQEWVALNPTRPDEHPGSFKVNLVTGQWAEFATGDKGADLVAFYAYLKGITQGEAALLLAEDLAITGHDHSPSGLGPRSPRPPKVVSRMPRHPPITNGVSSSWSLLTIRLLDLPLCSPAGYLPRGRNILTNIHTSRP